MNDGAKTRQATRPGKTGIESVKTPSAVRRVGLRLSGAMDFPGLSPKSRYAVALAPSTHCRQAERQLYRRHSATTIALAVARLSPGRGTVSCRIMRPNTFPRTSRRMAHPKRPRMQAQAFGQDRQTNDDVSLANLAKQGGNRAGNGVDKAIHDRTSHAIALKRGTKRKIKYR